MRMGVEANAQLLSKPSRQKTLNRSPASPNQLLLHLLACTEDRLVLALPHRHLLADAQNLLLELLLFPRNLRAHVPRNRFRIYIHKATAMVAASLQKDKRAAFSCRRHRRRRKFQKNPKSKIKRRRKYRGMHVVVRGWACACAPGTCDRSCFFPLDGVEGTITDRRGAGGCFGAAAPPFGGG